MPKKTKTKNAQESSALFRELYDLFMVQIEPDLTTENIEFLAEVYADESEDQRQERMEWYAECFDRCEKHISLFLFTYKKEMTKLKRTMERVGSGELQSDGTELADIQQAISEL